MLRFGLLFLVCIAVAPTRGTLAQRTPSHPYSQQLAHDCDALLREAWKRPYGWGWAQTAPSPAPANKPIHPPTISLQPGDDPTAGVLLLWAAEQLGDAHYQEAAVQAARAVVFAQDETGKFPAQVSFGESDKAREPATVVPDRASTRAALTLLLCVCDAQGEKRDEPLERSARRAATWMRQQQPAAGTWPIAYPPGAAPAQCDAPGASGHAGDARLHNDDAFVV
jgi:hypothetical protein